MVEKWASEMNFKEISKNKFVQKIPLAFHFQFLKIFNFKFLELKKFILINSYHHKHIPSAASVISSQIFLYPLQQAALFGPL